MAATQQKRRPNGHSTARKTRTKKSANPLTYEDLKFPVFCNTHVLGSISGVELTIEDAIRAALVTRSNIFFIGNRGTGKTQAASDIYHSFFGGKGLFAEGRPDFKIDELYTRVNLEALRTAGSTEEIVELTEGIKDRLFFIDEINRCPEITQNQFFSLANGYIIHKGKRCALGNGEYSLAIATGNVGNGEFSGTFRMDSALLDRWHLILDLDFYSKTPEDSEKISEHERDPRLKDAPLRDISDKIVEAYKSIGRPSSEMELIARYLTHGLDYCEKFPKARHSKRVLGARFPVICHEQSCEERENACGIAKPLEERAAQTIIRLAQGMEHIASLKTDSAVSDPINSMLLAYSLVAPHTRVLSQQYIMGTENFGNPSLAGVNAADKLRVEIQAMRAKDSPMFQAYMQATCENDTSGIDKLPDKFAYLKPFLRRRVKP